MDFLSEGYAFTFSLDCQSTLRAGPIAFGGLAYLISHVDTIKVVAYVSNIYYYLE